MRGSGARIGMAVHIMRTILTTLRGLRRTRTVFSVAAVGTTLLASAVFLLGAGLVPAAASTTSASVWLFSLSLGRMDLRIKQTII